MIITILLCILLVLSVAGLCYMAVQVKRNNEVYKFRNELSDIIHALLLDRLNTYKNDAEFKKDEREYEEWKTSLFAIYYKYSYEQMLFSWEPLTFKAWFTDEELKLLKII